MNSCVAEGWAVPVHLVILVIYKSPHRKIKIVHTNSIKQKRQVTLMLRKGTYFLMQPVVLLFNGTNIMGMGKFKQVFSITCYRPLEYVSLLHVSDKFETQMVPDPS